MFKRCSLYANIVNDNYAAYRSASIQESNPYRNMRRVEFHYVEGFKNVILDPNGPVTARSAKTVTVSLKSFYHMAEQAPSLLAFTFLLPVGMVAFIINAAVQTTLSQRRLKEVKTNNTDENSSGIWACDIHKTEQGVGAVNGSPKLSKHVTSEKDVNRGNSGEYEEGSLLDRYQSEMIKSLGLLNWRKYPVWIHDITNSHGAIIFAAESTGFHEGRIVLLHFSKEFLQ
jgi:hypothetical protein